MTLLELTEPIFQYVCRLNRLARRAGTSAGAPGATRGDTAFFTKAGSAPRGMSLDYAVVRSEMKALFEDLLQRSSGDGRLASQAGKVELPLLFFVDSMISESALSFAAQWNQNRLAYERNELAGDEKFFELLEETLKESSDEASERLAVFYICVGLGFAGVHFNQPEYLRRTMLTIAPRIRHVLEADQGARICPESYEGVDTRNLVRPASSRMAVIVILFLCFTLATLLTYFLLYRDASNELSNALTDILDQNSAVAAESATK
jgi:type VI protein secretion system component VasF